MPDYLWWICILILQAEIITGQRNNLGHLKIGSFNVQIFGASKAGKPAVMGTLAKIIQEYDIILIQEIRDSKQTAIVKLLQQTNELGPSQYDMKISARLGRSSTKEQYAFLFRNDTGMLEAVDTYQYPDSEDSFEREPYAVKFKSKYTIIPEFVLAGVHIDPDVAVEEIDSLPAVHDAISDHWDTDDIAIMGDFNADCSYVSKKKLGNLALRNDDKYVWLIGDDEDTTTKSTDCAYDRIVLTGSDFVDGVVDGSPRVFRFDTQYGLTSDETTAVSDHYPVEFSLKMTSRPDTSTAPTSRSHSVPWILTTYWTALTEGALWDNLLRWLRW